MIYHLPTDPLIAFGPQDQEIGDLYVIQERRATDFDAPKSKKGGSGSANTYVLYNTNNKNNNMFHPCAPPQ